jgi:hypothetical protein
MTNGSLTANRVSVSAADVMKLVPPFIDQHGSVEDKNLANEMLRISIETRVLLGQFFLYVALTRSRDFGSALNASDAKEGVAIVIGSLMRTMVVTIAALFDEDPRTSNIDKILRTALHSDRYPFFQSFHKQYGVEADAEKSRKRLIKYGRAIRKGKLRDAIRRLVSVRNTFVAHIEFEPATRASHERAIVRDFDHVISAAAIIVGEANVFTLGRRIDISSLRKILRREAGGLVSTLRS